MKEFGRTFASYFIIGLSATAVDLGLFLLLRMAALPISVAAMISVTIAVCYNYVLLSYFAYKVTAASRRRFVIFFSWAIVGIILNTALTFLLAERAMIWPPLAKTISIAVVFLVNFAFNTFVTFAGTENN